MQYAAVAPWRSGIASLSADGRSGPQLTSFGAGAASTLIVLSSKWHTCRARLHGFCSRKRTK